MRIFGWRKWFVSMAALGMAANLSFALDKPKTADKDNDGQIDHWYEYDSKGFLKRRSVDKNQDGKPDSFRKTLENRSVLDESDRNFDGKIDQRILKEWKLDKKMITGMSRSGVAQYTAAPGYVSVWTEEDNDYDGKIDVYKERGNTTSRPDKIGQSILKDKS